jgi:hypothetical protein
MNPDKEARIRERAYTLWVEEGRIPGRSDEYWYRAEQEVETEAAPGSDDASVYSIPDSEALTGEPDPGSVPGGPDVAAAGIAPLAEPQEPQIRKRTRVPAGSTAAKSAAAEQSIAKPRRTTKTK